MAVSGVTDLAGRMLAGRYRLLGVVGSGASGRVYVADDTRLRRRVAVKVLHAALADDAGFLRRFRKEAQLAASLHHPNVVTVYDWGEDVMPFMVLELLEGGSLRGILDAGTRLTPAQAAHVGRQVTDALEYAHNRGLVHRDVKPANLLYDEHGIVRVADFGLARALAEASLTEPSGSVLGTARYASPEQASGAALDGRSDLYALSLVLVEAVTGRVPFVADTPIGTLAARTHRSLLAPAGLDALAPVVERAGKVDPAARYPNAATMRDALRDASRQLPPPTPLPLPGLGATAVADPHPTQVVGSTGPEIFDQDADGRRASNAKRARPRPAREWIAPAVLGALIVALVVGAAALLLGGGGAAATVPSLVGLDRAAAEERADAAGFEVSFEERDGTDPAGTILEQEPRPGSLAPEGSTLEVALSRGPPPVPLPAIAGRPLAEVQAELEQAGFVVEVTRRFDENVPKDIVLDTEPPGLAEAPPESRIVLSVSDGPEPVPVPEVEGKTYEEAAAALEAVRLVAAPGENFSQTVPEGRVIGTEPAIGTEVPRDSTVTVVVSLGPPLVEIPDDIIGATVEDATAALQELGLAVNVHGYRPGRPVRATSPKPGGLVEIGSTVTLGL